jgi:membrane protein YqaA with SNARE-associated domain
LGFSFSAPLFSLGFIFDSAYNPNGMKAALTKLMRYLQKHANAWWYPPFIGFLAFSDLFILVVPTDAILISAVMISPRRWLYTGFMVALGSALGSAALSLLLRAEGLPWLLHVYPHLDQTKSWHDATHLVESWGGWGLFGIAISPLPQHAAIAVAAITGLSIPTIFGTVLAGRAIKYLSLSYLASHAPKLLGRIFGKAALENTSAETNTPKS